MKKKIFQSAIKNSGLQILQKDWDKLWKKRLSDHAIFCLNIFKQPSFNNLWVKKHVSLESELLQLLLDKHKSILFLTYHHPYQHFLFSILGTFGWRINVLAAPEESSELFPFIGFYIRKMHKNCSIHFNNGKYLFFKNNLTGTRIAKRSLSQGGILISLNDFNINHKNNISTKLFNRFISAPTGSIKLACRMNIPIVVGVAIRNNNKYEIIIREIDNTKNIESIMNDYFNFLEEILKESSHLWDGWNWFSSLPLNIKK